MSNSSKKRRKKLKPLTPRELNDLWEIRTCSNVKLLRGYYRDEPCAYVIFENEDGLSLVAKLITPTDHRFIEGPPGLEEIAGET